MKNSTFEKAYDNGYKNQKQFRNASNYITEHYVSEMPDHPLTMEARNTIAECMSIDYATGAELVKNKYLLGGVAIGVIVIIVAGKIKEVIEKRKTKEPYFII